MRSSTTRPSASRPARSTCTATPSRWRAARPRPSPRRPLRDMDGAVFIVVVNYRTPALAVACLRSLAAQREALRDGRVLVVDNRSDDDSIPVLAAAIRDEGWPSWVELLPMPRTGGFA